MLPSPRRLPPRARLHRLQSSSTCCVRHRRSSPRSITAPPASSPSASKTKRSRSHGGSAATARCWASYAHEVVNGKTIIFTTTNGTRALLEAARDKTVVLCAALLNRATIAAALAARDDEEALLVCAGSAGALSFEDLLCAGAIVDALQQLERHLLITDAARTALTLWQSYGNRITTAMASSAHAKTLVRHGLAADIAACARLDVSTTVPRFADGTITKLPAAG